MRGILLGLPLVALLVSCNTYATSSDALDVSGASDGDLDALRQGVAALDAAGYFVGAAFAAVGPSEATAETFGHVAKDGRAVAPDSLFDIGSVTKSFVGIILAELEGEGRLALDDTVDRYVAELAHTPFAGGMTLRQLATMTSGLPERPSNFSSYDAYSESDLLRFLADYVPSGWQPADGRSFGNVYSNPGFGLLGMIELRVSGARDFDELVKARIARPLGMVDTSVVLTPEQRSRYVTGYDLFGQVAPHWAFERDGVIMAMAPAGALHSTLSDMRRYLSALNFEDAGSALGRAITSSRMQGLGWDSADGQVVAKNGATAGFHAYVWSSRLTHRSAFVVGNLAFFGIEALVTAHLQGRALPDWRGQALTAEQAARIDGTYASDREDCGDAIDIETAGRWTTVSSDGELVARLAFLSEASAYMFDEVALYVARFELPDEGHARSFSVDIEDTTCVFHRG